MLLEILLIVGVVVLAAAVVYLLRRNRQAAVADERAASARGREEVDTVMGWPPEATRLLTSGERSAYEILVKALPECLIYAQVPLARFLKVPRRHSYTEWLTRVGHLSADLLICDRATLVIGVVLLQSMRESERGARRRARMSRVLKAAGVRVFTWREEALPSHQTARDQVTQRIGVPSTEAVPEPAAAPTARPGAPSGKIPVPEVVSETIDDGARREPPPSTWFDDLDSGRVPLDSSRMALDSSRAPLDSGRMPLEPAKPSAKTRQDGDPWSDVGRR
jgi:hypothetical protein